MTDQTIPADKVRTILDEWERIKEYADWEDMDKLVQDVRDLLPLPTLADMTHGERRECRWMQCDVIGWSERPVIVPIHHNDGTAMVICEDGTTDTLDTRQVTPRPDLPRLEWPGGKKVEDVTPVKAGAVIDSADDPRIPALPIGSILLDRDGDTVTKERNAWTGPGCIPIPPYGDKFGPWTVLHVGRGADQ